MHPSLAAADRIPNLDGLRALAIGLVVLHHSPQLPDGPLRTLQENSRHGVSLFFVISGFLITSLLLRERAKTGRVDLVAFYRRRTLRLMPLYYAALALHVALVFGLHLYSGVNQALFAEKLPAYVFYYSNLVPHPTEGPFFFAWSLAAEEQFYLFVGLGYRFLAPRALLALSIAAVVTKAALWATHPPAVLDASPWRVVLSYQEGIALGVSLAILSAMPRLQRLFRALGSGWALGPTAAAILTLLVAAPLGLRSGLRCEGLYVLLTLLVGGLAGRAGHGLLDGRALSLLGKASYAAYLIHVLVIDAVKRLLGPAPGPVLLTSLLVTAVLSVVIYRRVELPLLRWRLRLEERWQTTRTLSLLRPAPGQA